ncbi:MAG TPA: alpha/beta hydrolase [Phenylobacterium sp.]|uniref:alpha/beta hydrolase n=1 Tax=Phenylobacterium sp. TaxID=1871053 RepID=UPI002B4AAA63|nr:alpha/beta hydrolase [Phenylobacterium sp.]HKR88495.1 alpha/beta hydrolase [Phenylobacterium sp.]
MTDLNGSSGAGSHDGAVAPGDRLAAYPAQEPLSPLGEAYSQKVLALGAAVQGREVQYGSDPQQCLTVFSPADPNGVVFVVFHGGGWTNGYKEWMYLLAPAFNARGVTLVSATYRLAPRHIFPAGFEDCADAVAWAHRMLMPSLGPAGRLFVGGHSAGGHYAALLAVTDDWRAARDLPVDLLDGCVPISGTYWFGEGSGLAMRPRFLGTDPATDGRASPLLRLSAHCTPAFFLSYGDRDFPHLIRQAKEMTAALEAASVPVHVEVMEDCDHFEAGIACGDQSRPWFAKLVAWMSATPSTTNSSARPR